MLPKPFSLDIVLKVRKRKEDLAQQKLMHALNEQKQVEDRLIAAKNKRQILIESLAIKQHEGMLAEELGRFEDAIEFSNGEIDSFHKEFLEKKNTSENKRKNLIAKSQDHKVLQALKDSQNRAWKEYLDKKEANMLDEIAILHHNRSAS